MDERGEADEEGTGSEEGCLKAAGAGACAVVDAAVIAAALVVVHWATKGGCLILPPLFISFTASFKSPRAKKYLIPGMVRTRQGRRMLRGLGE